MNYIENLQFVCYINIQVIVVFMSLHDDIAVKNLTDNLIWNSMEPIRSIEDFKSFLAKNKELIRNSAIDADDIPIDDEWMQEDEWEEDYKRGVVNNGTL